MKMKLAELYAVQVFSFCVDYSPREDSHVDDTPPTASKYTSANPERVQFGFVMLTWSAVRGETVLLRQ